jgi:hypothetical protein
MIVRLCHVGRVAPKPPRHPVASFLMCVRVPPSAGSVRPRFSRAWRPEDSPPTSAPKRRDSDELPPLLALCARPSEREGWAPNVWVSMRRVLRPKAR